MHPWEFPVNSWQRVHIDIAMFEALVGVDIWLVLAFRLSPGSLLSVPERMYNLRRGSQFVQPNVDITSFGLNALRYEGVMICNMISEYIKIANGAHHFKSMMNLWSGPECHCGNCMLCYIYRLWRMPCIYMLFAFYLPFIGFILCLYGLIMLYVTLHICASSPLVNSIFSSSSLYHLVA